ncbi:hypothetical protein OROGR_026392 [Orobanche gracilis]
MENMPPGEGSGGSDVSAEGSGLTLQLKIKTLDSQIFSFHIDKNILVSGFKEKIAQQIGVPVGQQRLIFRGKVLKDDHLLSEYNIDVEHGDTLHLVERQPQPSPGPSAGETTSRNSTGGQDPTAGGPRGRIGQIAHSVVLGTFNVGDRGDGVGTDLSRVIGAALSSIGIGNLAGGVQPGVQASHGNERERSGVNAGSQNQVGNQFGPFQAAHGQPASNSMQNTVGAAPSAPSLNMPIPDSLSTLTEFMNRMEVALSQNVTRQNQSPTGSSSLPTSELPMNSHGLPTVEALTTVMRHAQRLLSDNVIPALSQTADQLDQQGGSSDSAVRGQVQTESVQLGAAMLHLGSLFLELGRTILTLRIGQSSGEYFVNAGPAVYISPSGPNPLMVQPFPLQTSSFLGGSSEGTQNYVAMGPVGSVPRNVNIHIHTGAALASIVPVVGNRAPNGEEMVGQRVHAISVSGPIQPVAGVPQASDPRGAEINAMMRNLIASRQSENQAPSGDSNYEEQTAGSGVGGNATSSHPRNLSGGIVGETTQTSVMGNQKGKTDPSSSHNGGSENLEGQLGSSQDNSIQDGSYGVPRGLGLGGLQPKRRVTQSRQAKKSNNASSSAAVGQQVLQAVSSSRSAGADANPSFSGQPSDLARGVLRNTSTEGQNGDDNIGIADAMSQVLDSPSVDGLLAGVPQQTGVGSPDMLRNMLQQFTQNPAMRNTVDQIAQQIDEHDLRSMFSGLDGGGQGGGFDLSRMMQQMIPIVSQALGGISSSSQVNPPSEHVFSGNGSGTDMALINDDPQTYLEVAQRLEEQSSPEEIFRSMVNGAVRLSSITSDLESVGNENRLAQEFMDMLFDDLSRRLEDGM